MVSVKRSIEFGDWIRRLRDLQARVLILRRIDRLAMTGNSGECRPVGEGFSEMLINHGPGYRVYFKRKNADTVILWAGDKSTQTADIRKAKKIYNELTE